MANLRKESLLRSNNVEDSSGYSDEVYTRGVDSGSYSRSQFVNDKIGYGLAQWTFSTRKAGLYDLVKSRGVSIADENTQIEYLVQELTRDFSGLFAYLKTTEDLATATTRVNNEFERPKYNTLAERIGYAKEYYAEFSGTKTEEVKSVDKLKKTIEIADGEVGVRETGENYVKYNDEYWGKGVGGPDYPWCVVFLWYVFKLAGVTFPKTAHCDGVRSYAQSVGRWVTSGYQVGDVVIFDYNGDNSGDHIGLIAKVDYGVFTTIEGNYSDRVAYVTRTASNIIGAYRPDYGSTGSGVTDETPAASQTIAAPVVTCKVELPLLKKGSKGGAVKSLQTLLIGLGYSCGSYGTDGDLGNATLSAIMKFQEDNGLEKDGIVGPNTWKSIIEKS